MKKSLVPVVVLAFCLTGCAGFAHFLGTLTPEEVQAETQKITEQVDSLRTEIGKLRDAGTLPSNLADKMLGTLSTVDTLKGKIADNAATLEKLASRLAELSQAGAGVAGAIPGGSPVAGGLAMASQALLLLAAIGKGAKGGTT